MVKARVTADEVRMAKERGLSLFLFTGWKAGKEGPYEVEGQIWAKIPENALASLENKGYYKMKIVEKVKLG